MENITDITRSDILLSHLSVELITNSDKFEALREEWNELFESCTEPCVSKLLLEHSLFKPSPQKR